MCFVDKFIEMEDEIKKAIREKKEKDLRELQQQFEDAIKVDSIPPSCVCVCMYKKCMSFR